MNQAIKDCVCRGWVDDGRVPVFNRELAGNALTREQARGMILELARDYRKASKKQKSEMLAHVAAVTGYTRSAAARALRSAYRRLAGPALLKSHAHD